MVSEMNNLRLIDLSKEDDCLLAFSLCDDIEGVRLSGAGYCFAVGLDNVNEPEPVEQKRTSLLRKSLDWDSGFFTSAGLLNTEELHMISKGDNKGKSRQPSCGTRKDVKPDIRKRTKVVINSRGLECGQATMINKSRKAGTGLSLCNRSQRVNLSSNSTNLTTKTEKISKIRRTNGSLPSSGSSMCSRRNISPRNTKLTSDPSSVLSPLSSICSSVASPAKKFRSVASPSDLQSPFRQATRSSIRNIKGSGLRMPSVKIGFFDEKQPIIVRGNAQICSKDHKVHKEISKNITNIEKKSLKEHSGSLKGKVVTDMKTKKDESNQCLLTQSQKKDMCSFEDQVNGFSRHLERIALDRDAEVRSQPSYSKHGQLSVEKSLDWDSAFFTNEGLLTTEEMCMIQKGFTKAKSNQESSGSRKDVPTHVQPESVGSRRLSILRKSVDWDTVFHSEGLLNTEELLMVNKGFKKAESDQSSTKSQILPHTIAGQNQSSTESDRLHLRTFGADLLIDVKPDIKKLTKQANLSKSTSLTTETNSKVQHSNKSSSSGSPKYIRRKLNYKNTKPTTCSSDTSPASSSHGVISPSNFQRLPRHPPCHNTEERKLTSQYATRSSIRNAMPSRLRMPSPRIGFFDEEPPVQLTFKGSMQKPNVFPSVERRPGFLHKAYGIVPSSLVQNDFKTKFNQPSSGIRRDILPRVSGLEQPSLDSDKT